MKSPVVVQLNMIWIIIFRYKSISGAQSPRTSFFKLGLELHLNSNSVMPLDQLELTNSLEESGIRQFDGNYTVQCLVTPDISLLH